MRFFFAIVAAVLLSVPLHGAMSGPVPVKVLLVGDSLSVGGFGATMQEALIREYGKSNVCVFASCGSSPEDWLRGGYVTKCGYRETTPAETILHQYRNGVRPRPVKTPKLRELLARYRPAIAIVQLGTNWMDQLAETRSPAAAHYGKIIRDFVKELRRNNKNLLVFWVLPPASSSYPLAVHGQVEGWINAESRRLGFYTINSRSLTAPYRRGKTGGDGVHYNDAAARVWARYVMNKFSWALQSLGLADWSSRGVSSSGRRVSK